MPSSPPGTLESLLFRSRKTPTTTLSHSSAPLRFEGRSVQLLAAWTLVIAGAASTAQTFTKPRQGATPISLSSPDGARSLSLSAPRATRR